MHVHVDKVPCSINRAIMVRVYLMYNIYGAEWTAESAETAADN
jgi:hypothetical protein